MPLVKSSSKGALAENIRREIESGKKKKQAVAIAFAIRKASGGKG